MVKSNSDKIVELMKLGTISIPKYIFLNYKKIGITDEEFIIIMYIMNIGNNVGFNPKIISLELNINTNKVLEIINNLCEKQIICIEIKKNEKNIMEEYICLDLFFDKISMLIIDNINKDNEKIDTSLFTIFEKEFGRTLSPMEYEIINGWVSEKFDNEIIIEALKEAIFNGVTSLRYIDKILYEWKKKGYKSVNDVRNNQIRQKKKEEKIEIFDYDWLSGDDK